MSSGKKKDERVIELRRRGLELVAHDQFEKAVTIYVELTELHPEDGDWARRAADCYWQLKDERRRLKYSIVAAEAYCDAGFFLKAIAMCKVVLGLDPHHKETQERLALLYAKRPLAAESNKEPGSFRDVTEQQKNIDSAVQIQKRLSKTTPRRDAQRERARLAAAAALRQIRAQRLAQQELFLDSVAATIPEEATSKSPISLPALTQESRSVPSARAARAPSAPAVLPLNVNIRAPSLQALSLRTHLPSVSRNLTPHSLQPAFCISLSQLPPPPDLSQYILSGEPLSSQVVSAQMQAPSLAPFPHLSTSPNELSFPSHFSLTPLSVSLTPLSAKFETPDTELILEPSISVTSHNEDSQKLAHIAIRQQLDEIPLFSALVHQTLVELINGLELVELEPGQVLFHAGELAESMYVVTEGSVIAETDTKDGSCITLAELTEGEFFGEIGLLSDQPRQARVRCHEHCRLLRIERQVVSKLIATDSAFLCILVEFLRKRLVSNLIQTSPLFAALPVEERSILAERFEFFELDENTALLVPGQHAVGMYVLLAGSALCQRRSGRTKLTQLGPGAIFGEAALLHNRVSDIEVRTTSKCYALCLADDQFKELIMTHPTVLEYVSSLQSDSEVSPDLGDHVTLY